MAVTHSWSRLQDVVAASLALACCLGLTWLLVGRGGSSVDLNGTTWEVTSVDGVELGDVRSMVSFNQGGEVTSAQIYSGCAVLSAQVRVPDEGWYEASALPLAFSAVHAATGCRFLSAEAEELNLTAFRRVITWHPLDSGHIELNGAHESRLVRVPWRAWLTCLGRRFARTPEHAHCPPGRYVAL